MRFKGIINPRLCQLLGSLGHRDMIAVADAGLPIPDERLRYDVSVVPNLPRFFDVLKPILEEIVVEKVIIPEEMKTVSPHVYKEIKSIEKLKDLSFEEVPLERFKELTKSCKGIVRTGEFTPFALIILVCGVPFK